MERKYKPYSTNILKILTPGGLRLGGHTYGRCVAILVVPRPILVRFTSPKYETTMVMTHIVGIMT